MKHKAVFLDKDGKLVPDIPLDINQRRVDLNGRFIEGLQLLQSYGYLLVIVSNDSPEHVERVKNTISSLCTKMGIYLDGFYYCPHHTQWNASIPSECDCRKPAPGLLLKAAGDMDIDLSESWMIGDHLDDVETAKRAGCNTVLVKRSRKATGTSRFSEYEAKDLADAARQIVNASGALGKKKRTRKAVTA